MAYCQSYRCWEPVVASICAHDVLRVVPSHSVNKHFSKPGTDPRLAVHLLDQYPTKMTFCMYPATHLQCQ